MDVNELQIIGFGHSGTNILNEIKKSYPKAFCIELTADKEDLKICNADKCILLSKDGLGRGLDYKLGINYTKEKQQEILDNIDFNKYTALVSALGGGCSSGSIIECCRLLAENNNHFYILISFPFDFEGEIRLNSTAFAMSELLKFANKEKIHIIEQPKKLNSRTLREAFALIDKKFVEQLENL